MKNIIIDKMTKDFFVSIYFDGRRPKNNGKIPVKLRVFNSSDKTRRLYPTGFEFTPEDFQNIWETSKPRKEFKQARQDLQLIETRANNIAEGLKNFSFEAFEPLFFGIEKVFNSNVQDYYSKAIAQYKLNGQIGTASNYDLSLKSLVTYCKKDKDLPFHLITPQWLKNYEKFMVDTNQKSVTTVGIYLRPLRAIFNQAIADKAIDPELYPFGAKQYTIPAPKGTKKALTKEQLKLLWDGIPATPDMQKAKAFWFFSFICNGMNMKDVLHLKFRDIDGDRLTFRRAKTTNTDKSRRSITVFLDEFTRSVITEYGNPIQLSDSYIFSVIDPLLTLEENYTKTHNFIRFINHHFGKYAKSVGVTEKVSTYSGRHSFATRLIQEGGSYEMAGEALGHSSVNTTKVYFAGFEDAAKKDFANRIKPY